MSDYVFPTIGSISSPFGKRISPNGIGSSNHQGIDIAAPFGTPVYAPIGGTIIYEGPASGYGPNFVKMRGTDGYTYDFGHMSAATVSKGMKVTPGAIIGRIGSEGNSTGNHLHLGIKDAAGKFIDPQGLLKGGKNLVKRFLGDNILDDDLTDVAGLGAMALGIPNPFALTSLGGESCGIICQLQEWVKSTGIFQRLALAILAFIMLLAAFYLMKEKD